MPTIPLISSSCPRLRAICCSVDVDRSQEIVASRAAQAVSSARNATLPLMSATPPMPPLPPLPPRRRLTPGIIQVESFSEQFARAAPPQRYFDRYAFEVLGSFPSETLDLYEKIHEYRCAANVLLVTIASDQEASDTLSQQQTLKRLIIATYELRESLYFWNQITQFPGPFQRYIDTHVSGSMPPVNVQSRLFAFADWLGNKHALLCSRDGTSAQMAREFEAAWHF